MDGSEFKQAVVYNLEMSLKDQLDKLDTFYAKKDAQKRGHEESAVRIETDPALQYNSVSDLKMNTNVNPSDGFKLMEKDKEKMKKRKAQTITKWDTFQPYAFCRLSDKHKDQYFLQLFDQYLDIKMKLNESDDRHKKLQSRIIFLEKQIGKEKKHSPVKDGSKHNKVTQDHHENKQLKEEIKRLHEKIYSLTGNKQLFHQGRPQSAKPKQKGIIPVNQNIKAELQMSKRQVNELVLIIDELKATKFSLQNQLKDKQAHENISKGHRLPAGKVNNESQFQSYAYDLEKWKEKYNDLELCFNKMTEDKDRIIRELQMDNMDLKQNERARKMPNSMQKINELNQSHYEQKLADLERQKESLEREVRRLVSLPFNQSGNNRNQAQLQEKCTKLELALQKLNTEHSRVKQEKGKYLAELQFKSRENNILKADNDKMKKQVKELLQRQVNPNDKKDIDYSDYYRKLMGLNKFQGDDPVWRKYSLLAEPSFNMMNPEELKKTAQQIWKTKLQLLAHLQKAHIEIKNMAQNSESRIGFYMRDKEQMQQQLKMARARLDEWVSMEKVGANRHVQIFEHNGIRYDDSISVFEADDQQIKQLGQQQNYFDMFLGQLTLDEGTIMHNPQNKIKQINQMVSFITLDFYNHDTQHSHFVEGNSRRLANNFSFKVEMNQHIIKFLAKQAVVLELWSPQGSSTVLLGKGQIWLRDLVTNSVKDVSAVVRGKCPIYHQNDRNPVATLQYRIRMRLPIGSYCEFSPEQSKAGKTTDLFRLSQRKRLEVKVTKAVNLPSSSAHFVHFAVQGDDYNTEAMRGSSPEWNYRKQIEVIMDDGFEEEMKQRYFQFVIFDDEVDIEDDVVGIAKADLTRMIDSVSQLQLELDIRDVDFQLKGKLHVQFRWI